MVMKYGDASPMHPKLTMNHGSKISLMLYVKTILSFRKGICLSFVMSV